MLFLPHSHVCLSAVPVDEDMMRRILAWSSRVAGRVDIATAYFNISSTYMPLLMQSKASVRIVTASPRVRV